MPRYLNMFNTIAFLSLLFRLTCVQSDAKFGTDIAIKKGTQTYPNPISVGVENYLELVKQSKMFVDTTLFIALILQSGGPIAVTIAPRKWGKTINGHMLKTFLEIYVNEDGHEIPKQFTPSYKLFKKAQITLDDGTLETLQNPLSISQYQNIMDDYLGRAPVIYLSFKNEILNHRQTVAERIADINKRAYQQHKYLMKDIQRIIDDGKPHEKQYAKFNMRIFEKILYDKSDEYEKVEVKKPIIELCRMLYERFKRKAYVIIDDYDEPFIRAVQDTKTGSDDIGLLNSALDSFVGNAFIENYYLAQGIVMGVTDFRKPGILNTWGYNLHDCTIKREPLCEYFGFDEHIVRSLFTQNNISYQLWRQAEKWYNGFQSEYSNNRFYNPYSVANFLKEKKIAAYWTGEDDRKIASKFHPIHLRDLFTLFSGRSMKVSNEPTIGLIESFSIMNGECAQSLLQYLFRSGYLSVSVPHSDTSDSADSSGYCWQLLAKLSNNEAASEISDWMISGYQRTYNLQQQLLDDASSNLTELVRNESGNTTLLDKSMELIFKHCSAFMDSKYEVKKNTTISRHLLKTRRQNFYYYLFYCVVLKMQRESMFELLVRYGNGTEPNIVIYDGKTQRATVVEMEYGVVSPSTTLERLLKYNNTFDKLDDIKIAKVIGMSISSCRIVRSATKFIRFETDESQNG